MEVVVGVMDFSLSTSLSHIHAKCRGLLIFKCPCASFIASLRYL